MEFLGITATKSTMNHQMNARWVDFSLRCFIKSGQLLRMKIQISLLNTGNLILKSMAMSRGTVPRKTLSEGLV